MPDVQWILEIVLMALLAATLFHAVRLERALGVLKRDRAVLEELVVGFNASTRQAEAGIDRLRAAADGAGRQLARQIDSATALKDDLTFLSQRSEGLADRMDEGIRRARPLLADAHATGEPARGGSSVRGGSSARGGSSELGGSPMLAGAPALAGFETNDAPRQRSQAERDLLKALRMVR